MGKLTEIGIQEPLRQALTCSLWRWRRRTRRQRGARRWRAAHRLRPRPSRPSAANQTLDQRHRPHVCSSRRRGRGRPLTRGSEASAHALASNAKRSRRGGDEAVPARPYTTRRRLAPPPLRRTHAAQVTFPTTPHAGDSSPAIGTTNPQPPRRSALARASYGLLRLFFRCLLLAR